MGKNLPVGSKLALPSIISLERSQELYDLLGMSPKFPGSSPEHKVVQDIADFHVGLPLVSKFSGLGNNLSISISKFRGYDVLRSAWF